MAVLSSKPDRQPLLQKSLAPPPPSKDTESQIPTAAPLSWCDLMFLIYFCLVTLTPMLGMTFFGILQTYLPEVRLQRLDINALEVTGDKLVAADFSALLNVTNGSGNIEFGYRLLTGSMEAAGVGLGSVKLADMRLKTHDATEVAVHTVEKGVPVEAAAGKKLVESGGKRALVMDVVVEGRVDFFFGGKRSDGWHFKIDCDGIDQTAVDSGSAPICRTWLVPLSSRTVQYICGSSLIIDLAILFYLHFLI